MEMMTLNDNNTMPKLGFGTYKSTEQEWIEAVKTALKAGYRLIDTAAKYENEKVVGKGIRASGVVPKGNRGYRSSKK